MCICSICSSNESLQTSTSDERGNLPASLIILIIFFTSDTVPLHFLHEMHTYIHAQRMNKAYIYKANFGITSCHQLTFSLQEELHLPNMMPTPYLFSNYLVNNIKNLIEVIKRPSLSEMKVRTDIRLSSC